MTYLVYELQFEALTLHFGRRHLGFVKPDMTIFGQESGAEQTLLSTEASTSEQAWLAMCI